MAGALTSTLLKHHVALKLESILDKETKITHEMLSAQIETRLGSEEKGPDMKVWSRGKGLENVGCMTSVYNSLFSSRGRLIGLSWNFAIHQSSFQNHQNRAMISGIQWNRQKITLHTRVYFWLHLECAISHIAQMLGVPSLWTLMLYDLPILDGLSSTCFISGSRNAV